MGVEVEGGGREFERVEYVCYTDVYTWDGGVCISV